MPDDSDVFIEYLDEANEQLGGMTILLEKIKSGGGDQNDWTDAFRLLHAIEGAAGMLGLGTICHLISRLDRILKRYQDNQQLDGQDLHADCIVHIDLIHECHGILVSGNPMPSQAEVAKLLQKRL